MSSRTVLRIIAIYFLASLGSFYANATTREVLEDKLFKNSQELKSLEAEITSQESYKKSFYSTYLPSLNAVGGLARNKTEEDNEKGKVAYLQGSANIFSGLKDQAYLDIENQKLTLARANYDLRKLSLREELTEILTSMIGLHQLEKILDEEVKITQNQKQMAAKKVSAGLTSGVDNLEFELRESEIQIQRRNITQLHEEAHQKLNALFNEEIKDADLNELKFKLESLSKTSNNKTYDRHPQVIKARIEEEIANLEKQAVTSEFLPKLDLSYSFGRLTPTEDEIKYDESQVALLITIPLFSGFDTFHKRKAAVAHVSSKELNRAQTLLNTKAQFERLHAKFSELVELHQIYEKKGASAEKYYNLTLAEYKRGVKNSPDLVGATERYFDTKKKTIELQKELEMVQVQLNNFN